jgi:hypothetical protein
VHDFLGMQWRMSRQNNTEWPAAIYAAFDWTAKCH